MDASKYIFDGKTIVEIGENTFNLDLKDGRVKKGVIHYKPTFGESKNTADVLASSFELLQIAEMYYDQMKGQGKEGSISFEVVQKVLRKLKTR